MGTLLLAAAVGILLGAALGMFGGGGGILAVPLLVGLLGMDIDEAATTSLIIVLFGAVAGLVSHHRAGRVRWRSGLVFGIASILGAAVGATAAARVADWVKLAAFTVLLVVAALAMLRNARTQSRERPRAEPSLVAGSAPGAGDHGVGGTAARLADDVDDIDRGTVVVGAPLEPGRYFGSVRHSLPLVLLLATGTGLVTGFLGVGGGFLVVPALVLSLKMPVANATATGLVVVAIASLSALVVRVTHSEAVGELGLTGVLIVATVASSMLAARFSGRLSPRRLTAGFALLVLGMSVLVGVQAVQAFEAA